MIFLYKSLILYYIVLGISIIVRIINKQQIGYDKWMTFCPPGGSTVAMLEPPENSMLIEELS